MFRLFMGWMLYAVAGHAIAATFVVNSQADVPDANPGNGVCDPQFALPGVCSLRAAIMEANALPGADNIMLGTGQVYRLTRQGADELSGDLDITTSMVIGYAGSGARPVVDANWLDRAFHVRSGANVMFHDFDIVGGLAAEGETGGAVYLANAGSVMFSGMRLHGNQAVSGAAISITGGVTTIRSTELFDNEGYAGAALHAHSATVSVERSSVHGQHCPNEGACNAINVQGQTNLSIHDSTISGNLGRGLFALNAGDVDIRNSTIAGNSRYGLFVKSTHSSSLVLESTIIAGNGVSDCDHDLVPNMIYDTDGSNLDSDGSCHLADGASNLAAIPAGLTPLKRRGGMTPVHWPAPGSPALNAGSSQTCSGMDQHGRPRPQAFGPAAPMLCDLGAAEVPEDAIFFDSVEVL